MTIKTHSMKNQEHVRSIFIKNCQKMDVYTTHHNIYRQSISYLLCMVFVCRNSRFEMIDLSLSEAIIRKSENSALSRETLTHHDRNCPLGSTSWFVHLFPGSRSRRETFWPFPLSHRDLSPHAAWKQEPDQKRRVS